MRQTVIGVMGGVRCSAATAALTEALGAAVAREGWALLTGGRPVGVMEAASRGAANTGGLVLAVLPGPDPDEATPWAGVVIATGMGFARNSVSVLSSTVVVALPGSTGTLSEIAYAISYQRPVLLLGWERQPLADFDLPMYHEVGPLMEELRRLVGR